MALSDKNILITPNIGQSADPKIEFKGADASTGAQTITLQVYPTSNGTLSFEGSAGQLFSITNSLSGTIYSVNDVSGIPSIEVLDTGLVKLAQYSGNVLIGTGSDNGTDKLQVNGSVSLSSGLTLSGGTANGVLYLNGSKVATSGSALTFNGTELGTTSTGLNINNANALVRYQNGSGTRTGYLQVRAAAFDIWSDQAAVPMVFGVANTEAMRLTSTGLGIGTSSPGAKLTLKAASNVSAFRIVQDNTDAYGYSQQVDSTNGYLRLRRYEASADAADLLVLTTSGNLGLGVTPSANAYGSAKTFFMSGDSVYGLLALSEESISATTQYVSLLNNAYPDGAGVYKYKISSQNATAYRQNDGVHAWFRAGNGTAGNTISFTQAMTLDASGNLGVGTTSPSSIGGSITTVDVSGAAGGGVRFQRTSAATTSGYIVALSGEFRVATADTNPLTLFTDNTERARIDSSGNFNIAGLTASKAVFTDASKNLTSTGTLGVDQGGTGATTLTGLVKGNGTSAFTAATAGTDYLAPPSGTSILKANSGGALANAVAGTDYASPSQTFYIGTTQVAINRASAALTLNGITLTDPAIVGAIAEDVYTISDGAAFEIDPGNGTIQLITLGASRTPKATNFAAGESVTMMITAGANSITWTDTTFGTSGVKWVGSSSSGTAPTLSSSATSIVELWKVGSQVYGAFVGVV